MILKAIYKPQNKKCYINTDFVIDAFPFLGKGEQVELYTMDNDRGAYIVSKADFEKWIEEKEK